MNRKELLLDEISIMEFLWKIKPKRRGILEYADFGEK